MNDDEKIETSEVLERLRLHYISYHLIDENNYHFKELFVPGNISKKCDRCKLKVVW